MLRAIKEFTEKQKRTIIYGVSLALLLFLLKWLQLRLIIINHSFEIYIGAVAIIFTGLGMWLALKLAKPKPKTIIVEREVVRDVETFQVNQAEADRIGLTRRELEVLQYMAEGLSNQEIADRIFLS